MTEKKLTSKLYCGAIMDFTLLNGDCLEVLNIISDNSVNAIISDPPYIISKPTSFHIGGGWNNNSDKTKLKKTPPSEFGEWDKKNLDWNFILKHFYRILKPCGSIIIFFDIWKIQSLKEIAESAGFKQARLCRWEKTNPVPINSKKNYLTNATEHFVTFVKKGSPTFHSEYDRGSYKHPICGGKERTAHPTQKPLALMEEIILKHTNESDVVFDPFAGSGTTGVAALKHKRRFIGCEIEKDSFDICVRRNIKANIFRKTQ